MHRSRIPRRFAVTFLLGATLLIAILIVAVGCSSETAEVVATAEPAASPTPQPAATAELEGTSTEAPSPTAAPSPTSTPTPAPTATPVPTPTSVPTTTPIPNTPPFIYNTGNKSYEQGETIATFTIIVVDAEDTPTVTVSGLPSDLSYRSGRVSGTIDSDTTAKDYAVTISAGDGVNPAVSATFTITITPNTPPVIANPSDKSYERGESITGFNITVTDAEDSPTVTLSGLPSGLSYGSGQVSGTITSAARDYVVTISANDGINDAVSATFIITVTPRAWPVDNSDGDWVVLLDTDALTDREQVGAAILPRDYTRSSDAFLVLRCGYAEGDHAEVLVGFGIELEGLFSLEVQYRFDEGPVETERWSLSTTRKALFAQSPIEFIWQMMHSQELVIREEGRQTLIFDVEGLANALYPHRDKCNWIEPWHN